MPVRPRPRAPEIMNNKIVRTICLFRKNPTNSDVSRVNELADKLSNSGYEVQTRRICSPNIDKILELDESNSDQNLIFGIGSLDSNAMNKNFEVLFDAKNISLSFDLTDIKITDETSKILFNLIRKDPSKTFDFAYVVNNPVSSPYFPSGTYGADGFSIGFQPTDLAEGCESLDEWFKKMKNVWQEVSRVFEKESDFLGIDSSVAPLFTGKSSLINFIKSLEISFEKSATTDVYIKITNFIKNNNPKPVGLCGLMLPCLEDFELADEYEADNFSIERNLFLSLQSGLGIDTYPVGIDQNIDRVTEILKLVQKLSLKHNKPLSVRLVSDGKAKIGEKTDFKNQYLKDVIVREL